ncbi:rhodanese-like domain-containing protein [Piscinibacter sp. XHJ-5]|uniref:rhodanese-like domain-containing protein n=1 Tax=Piscinibacter sp. XHJ-5 TaxID=3037797 RepID=UPI0024536A28|nr:rhodanese-like domain-containing protein [Piscinibacter sp. XHJ-5]
MKQLAARDLQAHCAATPSLLLDVREDWEVETAAIRLAGVPAKHIPLSRIPERLGELDPAQPVVCICHHGVRSRQVVAFLERHGYESVYNLAGGIDAWSTQVDRTVPRY